MGSEEAFVKRYPGQLGVPRGEQHQAVRHQRVAEPVGGEGAMKFLPNTDSHSVKFRSDTHSQQSSLIGMAHKQLSLSAADILKSIRY